MGDADLNNDTVPVSPWLSADDADLGHQDADELRRRFAHILDRVSKLGQAVADGEEITRRARRRLARLLVEADQLEQAIDAPTESAAADPPAQTPPPPGEIPANARAERLSARRRRGIRHVIQMDVWDHDVRALVAAGELTAAQADDPALVAEVIEDIFERWLQKAADRTGSDKR